MRRHPQGDEQILGLDFSGMRLRYHDEVETRGLATAVVSFTQRATSLQPQRNPAITRIPYIKRLVAPSRPSACRTRTAD